MTIRVLTCLFCFAGLCLCPGSNTFARDLHKSIIFSKHNLSQSGSGEVKAAFESQVCLFCHTPHNATGQAPLWNRYDSGQVYTIYASSTTKASIGQPTGASKVCLTCHDGTVAMGMVRSRSEQIPFAGGIGTLPNGESNLTTNLANDHPISFVYDAALANQNPQLKSPLSLMGDVRLDHEGQLQCTSCHDPHHDDYGKFLVVDNHYSNLCLNCHNMTGWSGSAHNTSTARWDGVSPNPWPHTAWTNVAQNGCDNCHRPHSASGKERLLNSSAEEMNCYPCHNGNVASKNIVNEFRKMSVHPVMDTTGAHDPTEPALLTGSRHVECVDCHNPHAANDQSGVVPGPLRSVRGIDRNGLEVKEIRHEYELCLRCHGDTNATKDYVNRQSPQRNLQMAFDPVNESFHPVIGIGKNPNVPSLISPHTTSSMIQCTSCHNNNGGPNNFGNGPNGPHGSDYTPLLERPLMTGDQTIESTGSYALCYKCHDRNSILSNQSFSKHKEHVVKNNIPCTACHDPHGVKNAAHLINFDRNIVNPNDRGVLRYEDLGRFSGRCNLKCHNSNHDALSYGI